jgi:hypothetical protein
VLSEYIVLGLLSTNFRVVLESYYFTLPYILLYLIATLVVYTCILRNLTVTLFQFNGFHFSVKIAINVKAPV